MYANPIYSVLILLGLAGLYLIIRTRLRARYVDTYKHIDNWLLRQLARIHAFRSWVATLVAGLMIALPDIIVAILPIDLSPYIGSWWAGLWVIGLNVYLVTNRALSTKPLEERA